MTIRNLALAALAASAMTLGACATEEGYRQHMNMEVGRASDEILMKWGAPNQRTQMSGGQEMWSYTKTTIDETAGYYRDESRQVTRTFTDKDGKQKTETITETFPVWQPPQVYRSSCTTRFVMAGGRVQSYAFEGEGCVAEEIQ